MNKNELMILVLNSIKRASFMPIDKGTLKDKAIYAEATSEGFNIVFNGDILKYITGVNYLPLLEEGTKPHIIGNAFGKGIAVWHPGSRKHQGFIKDKSVNLVMGLLKQKGMEVDVYVEY